MARMEPKWLQWAKELQAIAQIGLAYPSGDPFDAERYARIREIAAEILSSNADPGERVFLELFERETGYATPKVDVRGVVFRSEEILLVKEAADGRWTLPGGWADVNESPGECVAREVREESGFEVRPVRLLSVWDRSRHGHVPAFPFHVYKLFFLCDLVGGEARASFETSDVGFFTEDSLPELSVSRVTERQIRRLFEHWQYPGLPADFD
jgi:ADP-ribose pyrophosphatase YjhB (NUDIX family)